MAPRRIKGQLAVKACDLTSMQQDRMANRCQRELIQMLPLQETEALTQQLQAASDAADHERKAAAEAAAKSRADMKVSRQPP